ncbi:sulfide:quinone oxidoreductase [Candidatus Johnevansia muelleri]|uniref:Sulfide:quinone oxidoreductase n=1 Tax=Candidatus Johnevansia muelleri TaxID=1495769 RepID=A0A078KHM2_9GAMM|nr:sulfide:quinone oxidoreductase [Candidatus Evansia muelleri]
MNLYNIKNIYFDIVIIGGGTAGVSLAASLLIRNSNFNICIIEPQSIHYYQPAWTLIGNGILNSVNNIRPMYSVITPDISWIKSEVLELLPKSNKILLQNGKYVNYKYLVVCPGLILAWEKIEGLIETLGKNGVTSNYSYNLADYTWKLVKKINKGTVIFTQPEMPIKCAGAPQKVIYLSGDFWQKKHILSKININYYLNNNTLFGVKDFVPILMEYIKKYNVKLIFNANLIKVDGKKKTALFKLIDKEGNFISNEYKSFNILHVVPPQISPDFIKNSLLANKKGWCDVDPVTLQHLSFQNIFGLGDVCGILNAKTAAAARKQIFVVAENLFDLIKRKSILKIYDGYGSCPLPVERGKVILSEFGYNDKLLPTFPINPKKPSKLAWLLKTKFLPWFYWHGMLKGNDFLSTN